MEYERKTCTIPMEKFLNRYVDVPSFLKYCEQCPNFGTVWSCPPYGFDPETLWQQYREVQITAIKMSFGELAGRPDAESREKAALLRRKQFHVMARELLEQETNNPGSRALLAGSCHGCSVCARKEGKPCRFPKKMRYSVESLGADVGKLLKEQFSLTLLWSKAGEIPEYGILCGGLLLP